MLGIYEQDKLSLICYSNNIAIIYIYIYIYIYIDLPIYYLFGMYKYIFSASVTYQWSAAYQNVKLEIRETFDKFQHSNICLVLIENFRVLSLEGQSTGDLFSLAEVFWRTFEWVH